VVRNPEVGTIELDGRRFGANCYCWNVGWSDWQKPFPRSGAAATSTNRLLERPARKGSHLLTRHVRRRTIGGGCCSVGQPGEVRGCNRAEEQIPRHISEWHGDGLTAARAAVSAQSMVDSSKHQHEDQPESFQKHKSAVNFSADRHGALLSSGLEDDGGVRITGASYTEEGQN
jgi:hypothetical protein